MTAYSVTQSVSVTTSVATCDEIKCGEFRFARVFVPTGESITQLDFYASPYSEEDLDNDDDFDAIYETTTQQTLTVVAGRNYKIPDVVMDGTRFLKILGDAAGTVNVSLTK